ncbi:MAG: tetratricopeptide repeat protein [Cyclobacteriaceae bacterium]
MNKIILFGVVLLGMGACNMNKQDQLVEKEVPITEVQPIEKPEVEAISLLGDTLYRMELPAARMQQYDSALRVAQQNYKQDSLSLDNIIWLGRRQAYLGHYRDAISTYTKGLAAFPDSPELYRHRGHRYISTRQFDKAIDDLLRSAELMNPETINEEPNGIPIPLPEDDQPSSLQFNVYYHLGLAFYLQGEYGKAAQAYEKCLKTCRTDDEIAATADWLYMSYRRLGEDEVAEETLAMIKEDMQIKDNEGYFERLMMYKGMLPPDSLLKLDHNIPLADRSLALATQGYGVGNFYLSNGEQEMGLQIMEEIVEGRHWAAFGYIAAEADLARKKNSP